MTTAANHEILLPAIRAAGVFIGAVDIPANIGLIIPLSLCRGFLDGESPSESPSVMSQLLSSDSVGFMNLAALAQDDNGFIEFIHLWNPHFLISAPPHRPP